MDDLEFVQRCLKGDKPAWDEFVSKYSRLIYCYIHRVLRLKGKAHLAAEYADEIFHDIFLKLCDNNFKKIRSFQGRGGCSLASWLRQVTINHTIDYLRKLKPALSLEQEDEDGNSLQDTLADDSVSARDVFLRTEKAAHLEECIERLDLDDKFFVELHIFRGVALSELQKILKLARGAVDMRKSRIVERLRDCFRNKGFVLDI